MPKVSAGILVFRESGGAIEVLLAHPGGPLWASKDAGAWTIPKGEPEEGEDLLAAAKRELAEETGFHASGEAIALEPVRLASGKRVHAWAIRGDFDPSALSSNAFSLEWPPRSGRFQDFPEVDRVAWFALAEARTKANAGQVALLDELERVLGGRAPSVK